MCGATVFEVVPMRPSSVPATTRAPGLSARVTVSLRSTLRPEPENGLNVV